jgi:hypothetical protein
MILRKDFATSIEIKFWQTVIPIMEESTFIKMLVTLGYMAIQRYQSVNWLLKTFLWAGLGWVFGLAFGLFNAALF